MRTRKLDSASVVRLVDTIAATPKERRRIMARFYASIQGNRGEATRMGTASSGIDGHIRGWSVGARVDLTVNNATDADVVEIELTGGSNRPSGRRLATLYAQIDGELPVLMLADTPEVVEAARKLIKRTEERDARE